MSYHCRLEQEYVVAVVINRSGVDSGEVDHSIPIQKFHNLHPHTLLEVIRELDFLKQKCMDRFKELDKKTIEIEQQWMNSGPGNL